MRKVNAGQEKNFEEIKQGRPDMGRSKKYMWVNMRIEAVWNQHRDFVEADDAYTAPQLKAFLREMGKSFNMVE